MDYAVKISELKLCSIPLLTQSPFLPDISIPHYSSGTIKRSSGTIKRSSGMTNYSSGMNFLRASFLAFLTHSSNSPQEWTFVALFF